MPIISRYNAHDPVTGRLGLGINDAESFSDELIHQSGFPHIGGTDDVDEAGFVLGVCIRCGHGCGFVLAKKQDRTIFAVPIRENGSRCGAVGSSSGS